jgi:hypothetical protein
MSKKQLLIFLFVSFIIPYASSSAVNNVITAPYLALEAEENFDLLAHKKLELIKRNAHEACKNNEFTQAVEFTVSDVLEDMDVLKLLGDGREENILVYPIEFLFSEYNPVVFDQIICE